MNDGLYGMPDPVGCVFAGCIIVLMVTATMAGVFFIADCVRRAWRI